MSETKSLNQSTPIHDELFYWENVVFLVENTLFNVPRYHFENFSEVFKTCSLCRTDMASMLMDQEFGSLLNVMLHPEPPLLTKEAWLDALKLSNMWRLVNIRNIAIRQLSNREDMSFTDKIVWGRCYKVADWMITGYSSLIDRGDVISLEEGVRIGVPGTLGIWRSQNVSRGDPLGYWGHTTAIVLGIFEEEIKDVRREAAGYGPEEEAEYGLQELAPSRSPSPESPL
ncbi:hypothetical protein EV421DRAFT_1896359 [Armillaria borealis]|uniref:Uncharacterized protein n=1 Tax=Armillaria borealis TaxID=47425 RepID=A0AA39K4M4_9AGAR|nr:hypothetical protein EV421DRAFT_1896359 [Armillaria borealis]